MQPESKLVKKIMDYLATVPGCYAEKRHGDSYASAGQPDISGCVNGRRFEIEVKVPRFGVEDSRIEFPITPREAELMLTAPHRRGEGFPGNKPTMLQVERLKTWEAAGATCAVVYSVAAVELIITGLLAMAHTLEREATL